MNFVCQLRVIGTDCGRPAGTENKVCVSSLWQNVLCQLGVKPARYSQLGLGARLLSVIGTLYIAHFYRRERWHALVIQLLGGRFCWMA